MPLAAALWAGRQVDDIERALLPHQLPPEHDDWQVWLIEGGRGAGKTEAVARWLNNHVLGPPCDPRIPGGHRPAIIAPTLGDAMAAIIGGPSGLKAQNPYVRSIQGLGGVRVLWPNGTEAKVFGAYTEEDTERLRAGGNRCCAAADELATWVRLAEAWDQMKFGLRIGKRPKVVAATTPKPRPKYLELRTDEYTVVRHATTADNPHLPESVRQDLYKRYEGTRLGRQELLAEILLDVPGALWTHAMLERRAIPSTRSRCVVGVDPSGGRGPENDEQGIVVAATDQSGHGFVLADRTCKESPDGWGRRAVQAYVDFGADKLVVERNFGGDMARWTIETAARAMGVVVNIEDVTASRGKALRAQPVAALYEQGRVSHADVFTELEDEQLSWTPESGRSPNRMDALVFALTDLMVTAGPAAAGATAQAQRHSYHAPRPRRFVS